MEVHVKILGVLYIVIGALEVGAALVFLGKIRSIPAISRLGAQSEAPPVVGLLGFSVMLIVLAVSAPSIIAGIGLLRFKPWARIVTLILSALHLFFFPIGTALGVYGLSVLLNRRAQPLFRHRSIQVG